MLNLLGAVEVSSSVGSEAWPKSLVAPLSQHVTHSPVWDPIPPGFRSSIPVLGQDAVGVPGEAGLGRGCAPPHPVCAQYTATSCLLARCVLCLPRQPGGQRAWLACWRLPPWALHPRAWLSAEGLAFPGGISPTPHHVGAPAAAMTGREPGLSRWHLATLGPCPDAAGVPVSSRAAAPHHSRASICSVGISLRAEPSCLLREGSWTRVEC